MAKLSVVISAFNEEKKIEKALESASFADEIILVDNESSDKTVEKAKKYTSKIFSRPNNPMLNINKNFGFTKAEGDWILCLDSDEIISEELAKEIKETIKRKTEANGYWIPRKNIIFGKWIEHTGWYPDYQLRLFKKGRGRFPEKHVHEMIEVDGSADYHLKENLVHYNYENISQFLKKLTFIYGPNEAEQALKNGYKFDWKDAIRMPSKEFLTRFFAREGYKDGLHGLVLSLLMSFYHFIVFVYIWEKNGFKEEKDIHLESVEKELKRVNKELMFWFLSEKIKSTKSYRKVLRLKILRKFSK